VYDDEDPLESTVLTLAGHTSLWAASALGVHFNDPKSGFRYYQEKGQCHAIRDIFGNPFQPLALDPSWVTPAVAGLARAVYDGRAFHRMPELADALESSGCTDMQILAHCRGQGPHVRGCWLVDLLLGKP
jgi:hypothetical protein